MTIPQLQALTLGYLTGLDLSRWVSPNLLIKQVDVDAQCLNNAVATAIAELESATRTRYDLTTELAITITADRDVLVVKVLSLLAVRNAMGNFQNVSDWLVIQFDWVDKFVKALRAGQGNLKQPGVAPVTITDPVSGLPVTYTPDSVAEVVDSSFLTLG